MSGFSKTFFNHFFTVSNYFTTFYAICVIASNSSFSCKPLLGNFNVIHLNYDDSHETKEIFRKSVDLGCQAFVISDEIFEDFLEDFHAIHDECIQVYSNKHVVVYSLNEYNSIFDKIPKYSTIIDGKQMVKYNFKIL